MQPPTIGRIVHYVSHGSPVQPDGTQAHESQCRAAIVTEVWTDTTANLAVLNPTGMFFNSSEYDETATLGGSWHWPERT
ncbi:hypothetical protein ACFY8P_35365 [Streptomyces sp. NPDC012693]|uniref:hypothetical protein n=1 Tax=Streptomyces sp. NPDC012693 TaxID=3364844 RepID=UPI00367AEE4D